MELEEWKKLEMKAMFSFITPQTKEKIFLSRAQWQNITKYLLLHLISAQFNLKIVK